MTTNNLLEMASIRMREEAMRLLSVSLSVPTDEQIAARKARAEQAGRRVMPTVAALVFELEPLTYTVVGSKLGNKRLIYVDITRPLSDEQLEAVRSRGFNGIGQDMLVAQNPNVEPKDQRNPTARFLRHLTLGGVNLTVNDAGQPASTDIGSVVRVLEGSDSFPKRVRNEQGRWVDSGFWNGYQRYIIGKVAADWVAPAEADRRVIEVQARDDEEGEAASSVAGNANLDGLMREAFAASGAIGRNVGEFGDPGTQLAFLSGAVGVAPMLLTDGPSSAAADGDLWGWAQRNGYVGVASDGTITAKE